MDPQQELLSRLAEKDRYIEELERQLAVERHTSQTLRMALNNLRDL